VILYSNPADIIARNMITTKAGTKNKRCMKREVVLFRSIPHFVK